MTVQLRAPVLSCTNNIHFRIFALFVGTMIICKIHDPLSFIVLYLYFLSHYTNYVYKNLAATTSIPGTRNLAAHFGSPPLAEDFNYETVALCLAAVAIFFILLASFFPTNAIDTHRVPPNVRFEIDDVEAEWTYHEKFDYIHCRFMGNAIRNWPKLVHQCFE